MKSIIVAYLLWFFLGYAGAHKFYLERIGMGVFYLFTCGGFGIGWFIDLFTLPKQVKNANLLAMAKLSFGDLPLNHAGKLKSKVLTKKEKEKIILQTAKKYGGRITPVELAADTDLSINEAEDILKELSKKGYADLRVSDSGAILYEFLGFLTPDEKNRSSGLMD